MMPIFSCGATISTPSSTTRPWLGVSSPEIARSNVDLPQPEPPTTATTSPGATSILTPSSARTPFGYVLTPRTTTSRSGLRSPRGSFPAQERRGDGDESPVAKRADNGKGDDGRDDFS